MSWALKKVSLLGYCVSGRASKAGKRKFSTVSVAVRLFIVAIMANGLIANFAPSIGINAGTFLIDCFVVFLTVWALVEEAIGNTSKKNIVPKEYLSIFILFLLIAALTSVSIIAVGVYSPGLLSDLRIRFLYFLIAPALFVLIDKKDTEGIFEFFIDCGVFFCLFAIAQNVFASSLDSKFLVVEYDGVLGINWTDQLNLRSNALMGNSIEFGGVCVMLFTVALAQLFRKGISFFQIARIFIIVAGCYFTYSRIATAGMLAIFVVLFFRLGNGGAVNKTLQFVVIGVALAFGLYTVLGDSLLLDRFLGSDNFTAFSNESHLSNTIAALEVIGSNGLFGTGLGTQLVSDNRATADGWWFQLAAETGVIVFILYFLIFLILAKNMHVATKTLKGYYETISVVVLVILIYFMTASFVNSSFFGRADLTLFFVLVGLWLSSVCKNDSSDVSLNDRH